MTMDGGTNWRSMGKFNSLVRGVYFPVPDEGWAVGTRGFIAHFHKVEP